MNVQEPKIIKNVFNDEEYKKLRTYLYNKPKLKEDFDPEFERYCFDDSLLNQYAEKLIPLARNTFNSETLLSSYALFVHYEGKNPSLFAHKDDNACTYTIDMCVYQTEPWALIVDDKSYLLYENEALAYYGNDQMHGRDKFPNPNSQHVAMIFFHFVEPDHWWFTKGEDYIRVIRKEITIDQWEMQYGT